MVSQVFNRFLLMVSFIILLSACTTTTPVTGIDHAADNDLSRGSLKNAGFDSVSINAMTHAIAQQEYPNIHSVLIVKNKNWYMNNTFPVKMKYGEPPSER